MPEEITRNQNESNWSRIWRDFWITACFIAVSNFLGFIFILFQQSGNKVTAALWALACISSGGIVGFLFGIPRVLQDNNAPTAIVNENEEKNRLASTSQPFYRMQVNTNLEQISDWLTKIIVGVGLIEMRRIPDLLNSLSGFLAAGLGEASPQTQPLAAAIIVYFVVVGFLGGYLITRIYLAQAFSRADWGTQNTVNVGGQELTLEEISERQRQQFTDLQQQVIKVSEEMRAIKSSSGDLAENETRVVKKPKVKSILWVDDHPKNISLDVERLVKLGIEVVTTTNTADALELLKSGKYDTIITDMVRPDENGSINQTAGIDFINKIRAEGYSIPIFVYCSPRSILRYKEEAKMAGADEITSSSTELMKLLQIES